MAQTEMTRQRSLRLIRTPLFIRHILQPLNQSTLSLLQKANFMSSCNLKKVEIKLVAKYSCRNSCIIVVRLL